MINAFPVGMSFEPPKRGYLRGATATPCTISFVQPILATRPRVSEGTYRFFSFTCVQAKERHGNRACAKEIITLLGIDWSVKGALVLQITRIHGSVWGKVPAPRVSVSLRCENPWRLPKSD